jgi:Co/Zn/Cd efflux system component
MSGCCDNDCSLEPLLERQRSTLQYVLVVNLFMFCVVAAAAIIARSSALLTDSLDNLGDAFTYGLSLYAVSRGATVKARVALVKGWLIFLAACVVLAQIVYKFFVPVVPVFELMGIFSVFALIANSACLYLLWRHRHEDINMSSVWECSRNDIATNLAVFVTAGAVWITESGWPDIAVALVLVVILLRSALGIILSARKQLLAEKN